MSADDMMRRVAMEAWLPPRLAVELSRDEAMRQTIAEKPPDPPRRSYVPETTSERRFREAHEEVQATLAMVRAGRGSES